MQQDPLFMIGDFFSNLALKDAEILARHRRHVACDGARGRDYDI
jgi:hypothetical protein